MARHVAVRPESACARRVRRPRPFRGSLRPCRGPASEGGGAGPAARLRGAGRGLGGGWRGGAPWGEGWNGRAVGPPNGGVGARSCGIFVPGCRVLPCRTRSRGAQITALSLVAPHEDMPTHPAPAGVPAVLRLREPPLREGA